MGKRADLVKCFNEKYIQADARERLALCRKHMAEDFICMEPPELPQGGVFRGCDSSPKISAIYTALWDLELLNIRYFESAASDVLVMRAVYRWTSKETGRFIEVPVVEIFKFADNNKIQSVEVYHFDPAGMVATLPGRQKTVDHLAVLNATGKPATSMQA